MPKYRSLQSAGRFPKREHNGFALVLVLVFVAIVGLAASFGVQRATLEVNMASNAEARAVAFEAAEAALREAEALVSGWTCAVLESNFDSDPANAAAGRYSDLGTLGNPSPLVEISTPPTPDISAYTDPALFATATDVSFFNGSPVPGQIEPQYVMEWIGERVIEDCDASLNCNFIPTEAIRITARAFGPGATTTNPNASEVILQAQITRQDCII